jgi:DNA ligase (NAD+)
MDRLAAASMDDLNAVQGIGPQIAQSIHRFFTQAETAEVLRKLREAGVLPDGPAQPEVRSRAFAGMNFVFTGTLETMQRGDAEARVRELGGAAGSSVTKSTTHVVAGEKAGSKLDKARQLGIPVLTEQQFREMVEQAQNGGGEAQPTLF